MLTGDQVEDLAVKMDIPLVFVGFKDGLARQKLQYNKSYIINLENEFDDEGERNEGSHFTALQVNQYPNGKIEPIYFDSMGMPPPEIVKTFVGQYVPYNTKDIQSLVANFCGWASLAFLHYINAYDKRSNHLYTDVEDFLELFDDLNKSVDWKKNEYILKMFFQSKDPTKRNSIEVF